MPSNPIDEIQQKLARYQRLLESTRAIPWEMSLPDWTFTYVGPQIKEILGYSVDDWHEGGFWEKCIHPDDRKWVIEFCRNATEQHKDHEFEYRMMTADGRLIWLRDILNIIYDNNEAVCLQGFIIDVTERKQSELVMRTLAGTGSTLNIESFYKSCVKNLADVYGCKYCFIGFLQESGDDVLTQAVWAGNDFADNFEYNLHGTPCKDILDKTKELIPRDASTIYSDDQMLVDMGVESYFGAPLISSEGKTIGLVSVMDTSPMELTKLSEPILGVFASRITIETERHRQEEALQYVANYDALTGLPNRWMLHNRIEECSKDVNCPSFCLALLDLDGFKEINDTLGHFAGDQLLRHLKPRFEKVLRADDYVARLGGDEFAIVFTSIDNKDEAIRFTEFLREEIAKPFSIEQAHIQIGASIGLSFYPEHGGEAGELLRHADVAMYQAKRQMSGYAIYDANTDPYGTRRLSLVNDIKNAIKQKELILHYQPKVESKSGLIKGVEALVRWQHPVHGLVPPDEFIPLCQVSDLIHELTDYVINKALEDISQLDASTENLVVSVNISARNLMDSSLHDNVSEALEKHKVSSSRLQLEITENDLMHDSDRAKTTINSLNAIGVGFSIDDFGTGYSSLAYLKHLNVQELKIDKSFVNDMLNDVNDAAIVRSTVDLAHSLGLQVTAEGVEDKNTLMELVGYSCELVQGYYIAKPMPISELKEWLANYVH